VIVYSEPRVFESKSGGWSVRFYYFRPDGKKIHYRIRSGAEFGLSGNGNLKDVSIKYKKGYFSLLRKTVSEKLAKGWYPDIDKIEKRYTIGEATSLCDERITSQGFSKKYKENMLTIGKHLNNHFGEGSLVTAVLNTEALRKYLFSYSAGNYFNTQKAHLGAYIERMVDLNILTNNPVKGIQKIKQAPGKNLAYTPAQIDVLFNALKNHNTHLYLASLLMYTLLLRPHIEIRKLKRSYFDSELNFVTIPSGYTKNDKGRIIPIPKGCRNILIELGVKELEGDSNIFGKEFNPSYFGGLWIKFRRAHKELILKDQTFYSFRHSAAMEIYKKTKSVQKVKLAMDHSTIEVTFGYLRSLNVYENTIEIGDLPDVGS
jgi:integrase